MAPSILQMDSGCCVRNKGIYLLPLLSSLFMTSESSCLVSFINNNLLSHNLYNKYHIIFSFLLLSSLIRANIYALVYLYK